MPSPQSFRVAELWRYPVKSMAGERLADAVLRAGGIPGDRRWALRSTATGLIVSAKRPRYGALLDWTATTDPDATVRVADPDGVAYEPGDPSLDEALTGALDEEVRVVEVVEGREELYDSEWPEIPGTALSDTEARFPTAMMTEKVSFVDLAALHIVLTPSLEALAAELPDGVEVDVRRFRPNVVLEEFDVGPGSGPFPDLAWKDVAATVGESVVLHVLEAAPRCVMTTLPQGELGPSDEVLQVLAAAARKDTDFGTFACFGTYAEVATGGTITVGDTLTITGPVVDQ